MDRGPIRRLVVLMVTVAVVGGCGDDPESTSASADSTATEPSTASTPGSVRVAVTGVPVVGDDGVVELCPSESEGCFGIVVEGWLDPDAAGGLVRVVGTYDGTTLVPDPSVPPEVVAAPRAVADFPTRCDGMRNPSSPDDAVAQEAIAAYLRTVDDVHAGTWIDATTHVMNYWFVGDDADVAVHRDAIQELAGDRNVCVTGGARYSLATLMATQEALWPVVQELGVTGHISTIDVLRNVVVATAHSVDAVVRAEVESLGDMVELVAFIELLEDPMDALPAPRTRVAGDVAILTRRDDGTGMDALGTFVVRWDPERGCHYLDADGDRVAGVWLEGYTATAEPFTLYDFDGDVVAREGDTIQMGGGYAEIDGSAYEGDPALCGAGDLWIVSP